MVLSLFEAMGCLTLMTFAVRRWWSVFIMSSSLAVIDDAQKVVLVHGDTAGLHCK
jgi:hypothetical protein